MDQPITNLQKYENYKQQMSRLNRAVKSGFYLEAIFIEYAILEDRIESVLRHSGKFNPEKHNTLDRKLSRLCEMQRAKNGLVRKYFSDELIQSIYDWKNHRNSLIHALMKQPYNEESFQSVAVDGKALVRKVADKAGSYNDTIENQNQ